MILSNISNKNRTDIQSIFQSEEFNKLDLKTFNNIYQNETDYLKLKQLKELLEEVLNGIKLNKHFLDYRGNKISNWSINEKRGNKSYNPPIGWIGIGLNVLYKYGEDNFWIGKNNSREEWCVAYHGIKAGYSDVIKKIVKLILDGGFKPGSKQIFKDYDDVFHPGKKIGVGVYFTNMIKVAENYAGIIDVKDRKYKIVIMLRVKPDAIRQCSENNNYWILNGTFDEIRPYRILFKEI